MLKLIINSNVPGFMNGELLLGIAKTDIGNGAFYVQIPRSVYPLEPVGGEPFSYQRRKFSFIGTANNSTANIPLVYGLDFNPTDQKKSRFVVAMIEPGGGVLGSPDFGNYLFWIPNEANVILEDETKFPNEETITLI